MPQNASLINFLDSIQKEPLHKFNFKRMHHLSNSMYTMEDPEVGSVFPFRFFFSLGLLLTGPPDGKYSFLDEALSGPSISEAD